MEQVPVMTEAITATSDRLRVLSLDGQVEIISDVLDDLVPRTVRVDEPVVAADRKCERQKQ
jgi:hypothetical protein